ncbi:hypothetical protein [Flavobacterium psychrophilum]|uniref:hypothetical protein n=1 Tax=Flavobacterium psychrophilum TaxID=96345 RepID=UPI00211B6CEA|nr:hypothetical protein [Flavobacterium psychrophilum]
MPTNKVESESINFRYWTILLGLTLIIIVARFLSGLTLKQYGSLIVTVFSAGLISLILTPWLINRK